MFCRFVPVASIAEEIEFPLIYRFSIVVDSYTLESIEVKLFPLTSYVITELPILGEFPVILLELL